MKLSTPFWADFKFGLLSIILLLTSQVDLQAQSWCGTVVAPEVLQELKEMAANAQHMTPDLDSRMPDKVYFKAHIIRRSDGTGGLPLANLSTMVDYLNTVWASANIEFVMCEPSIIFSDEAYDYEANDLEADFESIIVPGTLNVFFPWTVSIGGFGIGGYAPRLNNGPNMVVMNSYENVTNLGKVLAHELGHHFGLLHTHETAVGRELVSGANCSVAGDLVCDTPADPNLGLASNSSGCSYIGTTTDPAGQPYNPDPSNLMSYADRECISRFSAGQYTRIRNIFENERPDMYLFPDSTCGANLECVLEVNTARGWGPGSLYEAINCANTRSGPDTITFNLTTSTLDVESPMPAFTDPGTVILGFNIGTGRNVTLDARDLSANDQSLFKIDAEGIEIKDLTIDRFLRSSGSGLYKAAFQTNSGGEVLLENITVKRSLCAVQGSGGYAVVKNCFFEENRFGVRYQVDAPAIQIIGTSMVCNKDGGFGYENGNKGSIQNLPDAPFITELTTATLSGSAIAGARVDVFENADGDCTGAPCQGLYLGTATADQSGFWSVDRKSVV